MKNDVKFSTDDGCFKYRVSCLLKKDEKYLFVEMNHSGIFCLPGGHVELGEDSKTAAIREFSEETLINCSIDKYMGMAENFFMNTKGKKMHELCFYYLLKAEDDIKTTDYTRVEDDSGYMVDLNFKWLGKDELDKYNVKPNILVELIKNDNLVFNHLIIDDLNK